MFESIVSLVPRTLYHIMTVPDAAVSFRWLVQLPSIPKPIEGLGNMGGKQESEEGILSKITGAINDGLNWVTDTVDSLVGTTPLMMRAERVTLPFENITTTNSRTQARQRSFADSISVDDVTIVFYEDINFSALTYFDKWKRSIVNEYGVFRCPEGEDGYARDIPVHLFDTVGLKKGVINLRGCFPQQIQAYELGSESGVIKTSVTLSVQRVEWEPFGLFNSGGAAASIATGYQNFSERF